MSETDKIPLEKIDDYRWKIPQSYKPGMLVPGIIYADEKLLNGIYRDKALEQVANVAFLAGDRECFFGNAGYALGVWFSYRRRGCDGY